MRSTGCWRSCFPVQRRLSRAATVRCIWCRASRVPSRARPDQRRGRGRAHSHWRGRRRVARPAAGGGADADSRDNHVGGRIHRSRAAQRPASAVAVPDTLTDSARADILGAIDRANAGWAAAKATLDTSGLGTAVAGQELADDMAEVNTLRTQGQTQKSTNGGFTVTDVTLEPPVTQRCTRPKRGVREIDSARGGQLLQRISHATTPCADVHGRVPECWLDRYPGPAALRSSAAGAMPWLPKAGRAQTCEGWTRRISSQRHDRPRTNSRRHRL